MKIAVAGATGRMGRCVIDLAARDNRFDVVAAITNPQDPRAGSRIGVGDHTVPLTTKLETPVDALIEFTVADGTIPILAQCEHLQVPMIIGATGHNEEQLARIQQGAHLIPIVKASNFSAGIQTILDSIGGFVRSLGNGYDIEVVETHHRNKVDAPSGTALTIVDELLDATGRTGCDVIFGRHGETGVRPKGQIAVHTIRLGDQIGTHEIHLSGHGETITLRHTAHSRETFASGALRAAAWIEGKKPGFYTMRDVIEHNC